MTMLNRGQILAAIKAALEPRDFVYAMWEGGATAFNRVDEWSDIDLQVDVEDSRIDDTFEVIEQTLLSLSPINLKYKTPQLPWQGMSQTFYRLQNASPFLLIDTVVIKHSAPEKLLAHEIHGHAKFHFDKANVSNVEPINSAEWNTRLRDRAASLRVTFDLYQILTLKELNRGNTLEALSFYNGFTLRPLVEVLRMRYKPMRYNFHTRYVQFDLPIDVVRRLESLFFVASSDDIRNKRELAEAWFDETIANLKFEE